MKGYKVFNPDWTCRGYQFEVGKIFEENINPRCCDIGFHFCTKASDCFNYYKFDSNNKVAEVEALGLIDLNGGDSKCCTNKIHIIRELTWHEVLDLVNTGKDCTGFCNSGDCNSGNRNSGNRNSGDCNSGNRNSGDWNSGNRNSGNRNSGNRNSGDWNKSSNCVGCFNTVNQPILFFDKPTHMTFEEWRSSDAYWLMNGIDFIPTEWIYSEDMSDEEKKAHPEHEVTGGYLKKRDNTDCCIKWWKGLSEREKNIIKQIPNFDEEKFFEITGIKVGEM